jgi:hypothetical protein
MAEDTRRWGRAAVLILASLGVVLIGAGLFVSWACGLSFSPSCGDGVAPLTVLGILAIVLAIGLATLHRVRHRNG